MPMNLGGMLWLKEVVTDNLDNALKVFILFDVLNEVVN
jgi:hypothetical protein